MKSVDGGSAAVNGSQIPTTEVVAWIEKLANKADINGNSARLRTTAIRQFEDVVAEDEPKEVGWMLKNLDRLTERWARRNPGAKADTAKTYATRVRTTLQEYLKWSAAPHEYDPKMSAPKPKKDEAKKTKVALDGATVKTDEFEAPFVAKSSYEATADRMDRIRLGGGRDLFYLAPKDGLFLKDAIRSAYSLILACEDYDSSLTPMQIMAQALNGGS